MAHVSPAPTAGSSLGDANFCPIWSFFTSTIWSHNGCLIMIGSFSWLRTGSMVKSFPPPSITVPADSTIKLASWPPLIVVDLIWHSAYGRTMTPRVISSQFRIQLSSTHCPPLTTMHPSVFRRASNVKFLKQIFSASAKMKLHSSSSARITTWSALSPHPRTVIDSWNRYSFKLQ